MVTFNTTVRQMTEMFQWPKCLSKNDRNVFTKKTIYSNTWHSTDINRYFKTRPHTDTVKYFHKILEMPHTNKWFL